MIRSWCDNDANLQHRLHEVQPLFENLKDSKRNDTVLSEKEQIKTKEGAN